MRAQLLGHVFIYIITIVLVSLLLAYGYNAISTFKEKANQISFIKLKNDLQNTIEVLSFDFGSVKVKEFTVPENINFVCFVKNYNGLPTNLQGTGYPLLEDSVKSGIKKNVFLISNKVEESFYAETIDIADNKLKFCIKVIANRIKLTMEGKGDHTVIS